jgi:aldehyde:ferredoxin oxidoreductase
LLRVDLSTETITSEAIPEEWLSRYVGGKGLGARYLHAELASGVDPLGPENVLLFMLGPLSGLAPGDPRYAAITKSPLTGTFLDSYSGGRFPAELTGALGKHMGLLVTGQADRPVAIVVEDGIARLDPAEEVWGRDAVTTDEAFGGAVACIGPAGENSVGYATIASEHAEHHAGRGGAGTVMGSKRLKAVVARGDPPSVDTELQALHDEYGRRYARTDVGQWRAASGVLETVDFADEVGALSTRGWKQRRFEGVEGIGIEAARETASGREREASTEESVPADPGDFRVDTDAGESVPRGATAMALGAGLGIDDFDAVATLGETCNRLGMDLISAGGAIAWAIRASERGAIDREFAFGEPEDARDLLGEIASRETPIGDGLADGVEAASERFGAEELIPTVKAMELPSYDPRGAPSMALAYATSDRGACHRRALPIETEAFTAESWSAKEAAEGVIAEQDIRSVLWSLIVDDFAGATFEDLGAEWLTAIGRPYEFEELRTVGERVWTLTRLFNVREGIARAEDSLPASLSSTTESESNDNGIDVEEFDATLDAYYALRGWSDEGRPTWETVERLGLDEAVNSTTPIDDRPDAYPATARATDRSET